jgi:hypothetical protein
MTDGPAPDPVPTFIHRFLRARLIGEALEWPALPAFRGLTKLWVRADGIGTRPPPVPGSSLLLGGSSRLR